jgi:alpha-L-fucosidase 2
VVELGHRLLWLSAHVYDHVVFGSAPPGFVERTALPVHRAAVSFALDLLVEDGDGLLVVSPSTSPENTFHTTRGRVAAVTAGATMDQELVAECFVHYLALLAPNGGAADDHALAAEVSQALDRLRLPEPTGDVLPEWASGHGSAEPGHRHFSHLYGLHPGRRVTQSGDPLLVRAAAGSLAGRLAHGGGHTGWSRAWTVCLAARVRQGDRAADHLRVLHDDLLSSSLLDLHPVDDWPGGAVFQIDGNLGVVAGIAELLVQCVDGTIDVLPALPSTWTAGRLCGLRVPGGHRVDVSWDGAGSVVRVTAGRTGEVVLRRGTSSAGAVLEAGACREFTFPAST